MVDLTPPRHLFTGDIPDLDLSMAEFLARDLVLPELVESWLLCRWSVKNPSGHVTEDRDDREDLLAYRWAMQERNLIA